ncbi:MAG: hypothetical protein VCC01_06675 [Candidatus Hydrogenedentota bacterium]
MRETLLHANESGDEIDIDQVAEKGRSYAKTIHAELIGAFQRWEMQTLVMDKQFEKLEEAFELLKRHDPLTADPPRKLTDPPVGMRKDSFTAEEHRDFLGRVLGTDGDDSQADS